MTSLQDRFGRLRARKQDHITKRVMLSDSRAARTFEKLAKAQPTNSDDAQSYIAECAAPVDDAYTKSTFRAACLIEDILTQNQVSASFEYQGSVTNNTHIKIHSDIDLLVITDSFVTLEAPLKAENPYAGNPIDELINLRSSCENLLASNFHQSVNIGGAKAISVASSELPCKVDIVPANWLDTENYRILLDKKDRGIQVLDKNARRRIKNFPFLHNYLINERDDATGGLLRRLVRLVKSIRSDSDDNIAVSSYDIVGLCYNMPDDRWPGSSSNSDIYLLVCFNRYIANVIANEELQKTLYVPNAQRLIFGSDGLQVAQLVLLYREMTQLARTACSGGPGQW